MASCGVADLLTQQDYGNLAGMVLVIVIHHCASHVHVWHIGRGAVLSHMYVVCLVVFCLCCAQRCPRKSASGLCGTNVLVAPVCWWHQCVTNQCVANQCGTSGGCRVGC